MSEATIKLGYEVGSGAEVRIPLKHMAITGQTQESGKTTTLEALITRSELRAIAFITKRGEGSFVTGRRIPPFFRERADWEFVESILEATMKARMKFERAWIVKATRGAKTLGDVRRKVEELGGHARGSLNQDMYMLLGEYLDKVLPVLQTLPRAERVSLEPGLNVMDLAGYPEELQSLVISSTLQQIYEHERGVVTVIPEAWKFVPQGRKTPVKLVVEHLAREGAGLKNFLWIDSQDMAGVEKLTLRAAAVWLIGVQREVNEVKRALGSIPANIKKPKAGDVATLGLGQFFACFKETVRQVYVQPAWLLDEFAREIAMGRMPVSRAAKHAPRPGATTQEDPMDELLRAENATLRQNYQRSVAQVTALEHQIADMQATIADLQRRLSEAAPDITRWGAAPVQSSAQPAASAADVKDLAERLRGDDAGANVTARLDSQSEQLFQWMKARLLADAETLPALLKLTQARPELQVTVQRQVLEADGGSQRGQIAQLIADGFFLEPRRGSEALKELERRGQQWNFGRFAQELSEVARLGFLYVTQGKDDRGRPVQMYQAVPGMKVNIRELEAV